MKREEMLQELKKFKQNAGPNVSKSFASKGVHLKLKTIMSAEALCIDVFEDEYTETDEIFDTLDSMYEFLNICVNANAGEIDFTLKVWVSCDEDDLEDFNFTYSVALDGVHARNPITSFQSQTESLPKIKETVLQLTDKELPIIVDCIKDTLNNYFD